MQGHTCCYHALSVWQVPSSPFNPFAGGPKVRSPTPTSCGSGGSSGHRTVPLTALRTNSGGPSSATPAAQQAKIQAKLEALYDEKPAWLISPTRLSLEQGQDGQFVLLGAGAYGRCAGGWVGGWVGGECRQVQALDTCRCPGSLLRLAHM